MKTIAEEINTAYKSYLRVYGAPCLTTVKQAVGADNWCLYSEACGPEGHWDLEVRADKPETGAKIVAFLQRAIETGVLQL
jgi:hypothetical protein